MAAGLSIGGHPVHPALVHFPIALWTVGLGAEIGGWVLDQPVWWLGSFVSQLTGVAMALPAMAAGLFDYAAMSRRHPAGDAAVAHMITMVLAWLLFVASLAFRGFPPEQQPPISATLAAVSGFVAMLAGGWLGGRLVYCHGVGVRQSRSD